MRLAHVAASAFVVFAFRGSFSGKSTLRFPGSTFHVPHFCAGLWLFSVDRLVLFGKSSSCKPRNKLHGKLMRQRFDPQVFGA